MIRPIFFTSKFPLILALLVSSAGLVVAGEKAEKQRAHVDEFFGPAGPVSSLSFEFAPDQLEKLRNDPRNYAECVMREQGGKTHRGVGVKLKGGRSFRGIEEKPGMTVSLKKYPGGERFHGMEKFHLNNSVQDPGYLQEIIAAEMCRAAGVPAGRGTHALVTIQGKDRGLYVFKEAYGEEFLAHFFADPTGDLYDGGSWSELKETMEKDQGKESERANIKELIGACCEPDEKKRWARVDAILDVDAYLSFTAMEALLAHHDGYNFNHNNYRVYFDPASGKAHFIHHGMDQTFGFKTMSLLRGSNSMVWQAVFGNPAWQARYWPRLQEISANSIASVDWDLRIAQIGAKVQGALEAKKHSFAAEFPSRIAAAQKNIGGRLAFVVLQLANPPQPPAFSSDNTLLLSDGWSKVKWSGADFIIDEALLEGAPRFHFIAGKPATGAWQKTLLLERGRYRLEGRAKSNVPAPGLAFRARTRMAGQQAVQGDGQWQMGSCEFETPGAEVILYIEFKATGGEAWVDRESLRLVRVP